MKTSKYPGPDGIYRKILKEAKNKIINILAYPFNKSILQGSVPVDWKSVNVTPIFKKGDRDMLENYMPISLTFVVGKMLAGTI